MEEIYLKPFQVWCVRECVFTGECVCVSVFMSECESASVSVCVCVCVWVCVCRSVSERVCEWASECFEWVCAGACVSDRVCVCVWACVIEWVSVLSECVHVWEGVCRSVCEHVWVIECECVCVCVCVCEWASVSEWVFWASVCRRVSECVHVWEGVCRSVCEWSSVCVCVCVCVWVSECEWASECFERVCAGEWASVFMCERVCAGACVSERVCAGVWVFLVCVYLYECAQVSECVPESVSEWVCETLQWRRVSVLVCSRWCFSFGTGVTRTNTLTVWTGEIRSWRRGCRWVTWLGESGFSCSLSCVLSYAVILRSSRISMKSCRTSGSTSAPASPASAASCCRTPGSRWPPTHTLTAAY